MALGQEFDRNIPADVRKVAFSRADLAGMPADFLAAHPPGPDGKIVLTTDYPDYFPVRNYAKKGSTREAMWRAFTLRAAPQNIALLEKMLVKRQELANTLGYANWADYVTENKMIRSGKAASDFIERITAASGSRAAMEKQLLLDRKRKDVPGAKTLDPWDVTYYGERIKAERYHFDARKARPYFEASRVFQGVLDVSGKLFDVSYRPVENAMVWHPDVKTYDVIAGPVFGPGAGKSLGRVYLDLHPREGKYKHAAQFTVISGQEGHRLPEGALLCNFPKPGGLIEYGEVRTLFHEFGHLVTTSSAATPRWAANSGVRTEQDFVEAPSQMLEEWMRDPGVLQTFAKNVKDRPAHPREDGASSSASPRSSARGSGAAPDVPRRPQPPPARPARPRGSIPPPWSPSHGEVLDLPVREGHVPAGVVRAPDRVQRRVLHVHVVPGHREGPLHPVREQGRVRPETANRYRDRVLAMGGGKPAADLVADFLGRPYDFKAYEAWLDRGALPGPAKGPAHAGPAAVH